MYESVKTHNQQLIDSENSLGLDFIEQYTPQLTFQSFKPFLYLLFRYFVFIYLAFSLRGRPRLGWMDGVKVALGNRGMTVEAAQQ